MNQPERGRPSARIAILSHGTSEFDSRAQRIARTCTAAGDTVTLYSRFLAGLPREEERDGYRIVRLPLSDDDQRAADREARRAAAGADASRASADAPARAATPATPSTARRIISALPTGTLLRHRFRQFPIRPLQRAPWFARQVEPHDIWHGMWAGSLPALEQVRARHGGRTVYDARDVFLRSRMFDDMPRWQRTILTRYERRWAHAADAVLQVSEEYAGMTARDLSLERVEVVRNCPERWDPPSPRPDRFRELLGLPSTTRIVLYQGRVMGDRGIEQAMDAILEVPDAVLVIMGFGNQNGDQSSRDPFIAKTTVAPWQGRVFVVDPVPPAELLPWSASADVMVMAVQPRSENHRYMTPQKLWEALAAGVPVVAADMPGFRNIVGSVGCGVLVDPTSPADIGRGIRDLLDLGPDGLRAVGDLGLAAAHDRYNWEVQAEVLEGVYARLLAMDGRRSAADPTPEPAA
ncbi:MAG: glycosyltransferase [Chloroflexi bacterium]|nr:glycosyltransferase [Chloroflexota bacterium]